MNVVFILTDQQRFDSLGCCGYPYALTPNLDRLAASGTCFNRFITNSGICSPSRASMLTGLHASTHGLWTNGVPLPREEYTPVTTGSANAFPGKWVASHIPTFADLFKQAGYRTCSVGKLHLTPCAAHAAFGYPESHACWTERPELKDWHGPYYGFDDVHMTLGHGEFINGHYGAWIDKHHPEVFEERNRMRKKRTLEFPNEPNLYPSTIPMELHNSTWIGDLAARKIGEMAAADQPFLLWAGFPDPHSPFVPPHQLAEQFSERDTLLPNIPAEADACRIEAFANLQRKRNVYAPDDPFIRRARQYTDALIHLIDINVGKILQALQNAGVWDETIIVFTSDHSDFLGDYGIHGKCVPCCNSLNHVPFILRAPGREIPARVDTTVQGVDILPTLCELTGVAQPELIHGESMLDIIQNGRRDLAMVQHYTPKARRINLSVYDDRYRYTWYPQTGEHELYDHLEDPNELQNRADDPACAGLCCELDQRLKDLQCRTLTPKSGRIAVW